MTPDVVVFDLGGVLIDWDPRYLYRKIFSSEQEVERFLSEICPPEWNVRQDAGRPIAEAEAERISLFPDQADLICAFYDRWDEMLNGTIAGSVDILHTLKATGTPLYLLTNFSAETFPRAEEIFDLFHVFDDILVSGREKMIKPDPAIFQRLMDRNGLEADRCLFIDDAPANVAGARTAGLQAVRFTTPEQLRDDLTGLGLL